MKIAVVGLGLIGGSFCKAIKAYTHHTCLGVGRDLNSKSVQMALHVDAIDQAIIPEELGQADLSIICLHPQGIIDFILENQQYTGCTVNGKSTTVSYKVHKVIENPKEEYQIIPNTQEAIIDENVWLRVQELRKNKRRPTKTNRKSLFSGLVFCADCKSKLHFCAAKSLKRNQEFFRCANYKDGRGSCTIHFIRDVVLEMVVKEAVAGLADFVRCYESVFLYMQKQKCGEFQKKTAA